MVRLMEDRVFIEGFQDLLEISEKKIALLFKGYNLIVEGKNLQIAAFSKSELILNGKIFAVNFDYHNV